MYLDARVNFSLGVRVIEWDLGPFYTTVQETVQNQLLRRESPLRRMKREEKKKQAGKKYLSPSHLTKGMSFPPTGRKSRWFYLRIWRLSITNRINSNFTLKKLNSRGLSKVWHHFFATYWVSFRNSNKAALVWPTSCMTHWLTIRELSFDIPQLPGFGPPKWSKKTARDPISVHFNH